MGRRCRRDERSQFSLGAEAEVGWGHAARVCYCSRGVRLVSVLLEFSDQIPILLTGGTVVDRLRGAKTIRREPTRFGANVNPFGYFAEKN